MSNHHVRIRNHHLRISINWFWAGDRQLVSGAHVSVHYMTPYTTYMLCATRNMADQLNCEELDDYLNSMGDFELNLLLSCLACHSHPQRNGKWLLKRGWPLNRIHQKLLLSHLQMSCYMIIAKRCLKESSHFIMQMTRNCVFNDLSVLFFSFRLLSDKGWLKTKPNFKL